MRRNEIAIGTQQITHLFIPISPTSAQHYLLIFHVAVVEHFILCIRN